MIDQLQSIEINYEFIEQAEIERKVEFKKLNKEIKESLSFYIIENIKIYSKIEGIKSRELFSQINKICSQLKNIL